MRDLYFSQPIGIHVFKGFNNYEYLDMTSFRKSSMFIMSSHLRGTIAISYGRRFSMI